MPSLLDAFRQATKDTNVFEDYIEYHTKYIRALMVGADAQIEGFRKDSPLSPDDLEKFDEMCMSLTFHYQKKVKALKAVLLELLKGIDLYKSTINGYDEFDMVEWDFDRHVWDHLYVKYRPKGIAVSFWNCKAENIEYSV